MSHQAILDGIATGLDLVLANLRKLQQEPDPHEWICQDRSPLGRRRHCELARDGALEGARKRDGKWYVRRHVIDEYIAGGAPPSAPEADEVAEILNYRSRRHRRSA